MPDTLKTTNIEPVVPCHVAAHQQSVGVPELIVASAFPSSRRRISKLTPHEPAGSERWSVVGIVLVCWTKAPLAAHR